MRDPQKLRSARWFGGPEYEALVRRAALRSEGLGPAGFEGKPVIGICNSWSELTHCNVHLRRVAEAVKRGVWAAGGVPLEFPTISLGELFMKPTTMLFRNLMAMDVEECITANPIDGVVLLSGCDKTTPAQLMGAASADLPAVMVTGGPQLSGHWGRKEIGSGTDGRLLFQEYRAGRLTDEQLAEVEGCIARSNGHCMVMGTASTMASMAESLGITLPGAAAIPAADARRFQLAEDAGRRIVDMVWEDLRPSKILTRAAFENAVRTDMAIGGSTNAVVHLLAIAGRAGVDLRLSDFDRLSRETPFLANIKPSGRYLMEDFYYAGGLPVVMKEILPLLDGSSLTANGRTIAENVADAACSNTRRDPAPRPASQRRRGHRDSLRQSRSRRRGHQTDGCLAALAPTPRQGSRLRSLRRVAGAHRRRRPGDRRKLRPRAEACRPHRRAGLPRVGASAHSRQAAQAGD